MRVLSAILAFSSLLCFLKLTHAETHHAKICLDAKICVHNANEKCGINSAGVPRRFLDSCDIKEYNCLKQTDYQKTDMEKCKGLPPIPDENEGAHREAKLDGNKKAA